MALFKEKVSENGIVSKYHKISRVVLTDQELACQVDSYASKEYRDKGCEPVNSDYIIVSCSLEEEENMGIRQIGYKKIKALEQWSDAEDC